MTVADIDETSNGRVYTNMIAFFPSSIFVFLFVYIIKLGRVEEDGGVDDSENQTIIAVEMNSSGNLSYYGVFI